MQVPASACVRGIWQFGGRSRAQIERRPFGSPSIVGNVPSSFWFSPLFLLDFIQRRKAYGSYDQRKILRCF
jgi:hypothetical protein